LLEAVERGHRSVEADPESLDLAEPARPLGLGDAVEEVVADVDESCPLDRVLVGGVSI